MISAYFPKLDIIPSVHADFGPYLSFDLNYAAIWAITTELYYLILTPGAAVSRVITRTHTFARTRRSDHFEQLTHLPVAALTLLTATAFASKPGSLRIAEVIHVSCWLAQFYGHGVHEGRSPALVDNLLGGRGFFLLVVIMWK